MNLPDNAVRDPLRLGWHEACPESRTLHPVVSAARVGARNPRLCLGRFSDTGIVLQWRGAGPVPCQDGEFALRPPARGVGFWQETPSGSRACGPTIRENFNDSAITWKWRARPLTEPQRQLFEGRLLLLRRDRDQRAASLPSSYRSHVSIVR